MAARTQKGVPIDYTYPTVAAFVADSTVPFTLNVNSLVEELQMRLTGTVTLDGYTAAPTVRKEGLENLIRMVRLNGNAKTNGAQAVTFSSVDFAYLHYKTNLLAGTVTTRTDVGTANGVYNFETNATKFFGAKRIAGVYDATYLDTRLLQTLQVALDTRNVGAIVDPTTGANGTATLNGAQVSFHSVEWQGGAMVAGAPYIMESTRSFDLTNISGLDKDFLNVPINNIITRQTFKGCVGNVDYAEPSDAFFATAFRQEGPHVKTVVTGSGGSQNRLDVVYPTLQTQNKTKYGLEAVQPGYATYEYSRTLKLSDALDLRSSAIQGAKNQLDLTPVAGQTNTLYITDEQFVIPK